MHKEKIITQLKELADGFFVVKSIDEVNHKPHPYTVGAKHVAYASDNHSGILDERTTDTIGCAHPRCGMDYVSHTSDTVVFLSLVKDLSNEDANRVLKSFLSVTDKEGIDGFALVETNEKFRITD